MPHGTDHSAALLSNALARSPLFGSVDFFFDTALPGEERRLAETSEQISLTSLVSWVKRLGDYDATYLPYGLLRTSYFSLRPHYAQMPMICEVGTTFHPNVWRNLFHAAASSNIRSSDGLIFKSDRTREIVASAWESWRSELPWLSAFPNSVTIPNAVDTQSNRHLSRERAETRSELHLKDDDVVFLCFSRFAPVGKMDYEAILFLWQRVIEKHQNAVLLITGATISVPNYRTYAQRLQETARALGVANNVLIVASPYERWTNARSCLMSAADVFIHTTQGVEETSPSVILEAAAHELPVIASDWAENSSLVLHNVTGWLVDTVAAPVDPLVRSSLFAGSHQSTAAQLEATIGVNGGQLISSVTRAMDASVRSRFGCAGRRLMEDKYSVDCIVERRANFVAECARDAQVSAVPPRRIVDLGIIPLGLAAHRLTGETLVQCTNEEASMQAQDFQRLNGPASQILLEFIRQKRNVSFAEICSRLKSHFAASSLESDAGKLVMAALSLGVVSLAFP